jgi:glycosyltransferase involved in cell wall biosynthesis
MSYVIIGDLFTFPEGEAATNRVHTYANGIVANGKGVHVIPFGNVYTHLRDGDINGIQYYHPFTENTRSKYFLVRTLKKVKKHLRTLRLVTDINKKDKIKAIIIYTGLPGTFFFAWFLSWITGSKFIQEISEHPLRYYQDGRIRKRLGLLKLRVEIYLVDGILCISHFLMDFYRQRGVQLHRLLLVPSTVDPHRFETKPERPLPFPYIGYFGMLTFKRDNLDSLIEAFARIATKYDKLNLVLGGPEYGNEKIKIKSLAEDLKISDRLHLLEYMPREEIIKYIVNSKVLVMVRANDLKAQASFPSKLTEYLATGLPVVSVDVGEISNYLTDGLNAFIVEPGDSNKLAEKLDHILNHYDSALETAKRGRQLVYNVFNYKFQAKRIISFIDSLYKL